MSVRRKPLGLVAPTGFFFFSPLLALAMLIGCGGDESTVSGTVTLDGTPLDHGNVTFSPVDSAGRSATGSISSGGYYEVQSGQSGGLPAAKYQVAVASLGPSTPHPQGGPPSPGKYLTPPRYADGETSGLSFEVTSGSNTIDLQLTTQAAGPQR